jgi:hypothetical protein
MLKGIILSAISGLSFALLGALLIEKPFSSGSADNIIMSTLAVLGTLFFAVLFSPIHDPMSVQRSHVIAPGSRFRKPSIRGFFPQWVGKMDLGKPDILTKSNDIKKP